MLSNNSSLKYSIKDIEGLQNCKPVSIDYQVPELFAVSDEDKTVRWVRQLNEDNAELIAELVSEVLTPQLVDSFVKAGFERIVFNYEFARPFCRCCLALYRKLQMRELYADLMKCCQSYFQNRQQWTPLERILSSKKKTNQSDVPKMEKKTRMTKRRSYATIYLACALLEIKFMTPSIFIYILKDCLKSTIVDDLELATLLLENSSSVIVKFQNGDKEKFMEVVPRLEQLAEMKLIDQKCVALVEVLK